MITDTTKKKMALFLREFFGATSGKVKLGTGGGGTNPTSTTLDVPLPASTDSSTKSMKRRSQYTLFLNWKYH